jgi:hypothetical protein
VNGLLAEEEHKPLLNLALSAVVEALMVNLASNSSRYPMTFNYNHNGMIIDDDTNSYDAVNDYSNGNGNGNNGSISSNEYRCQDIIIETAKTLFHNKLLNQSVNRIMAAM